MSDMADQDEKKPFQIKSFATADRELAKAASMRAGLNMGEWVGRAVRTQDRVDRQESIFPPVAPSRTAEADDTALISLMTAAAALAAANPRQLRGVPGLTSLLAARVRQARGLPPLLANRVKPEARNGKTITMDVRKSADV